MPHYDPHHQDADWSGYVTISSRKHVQEPNRSGEDQWKPGKRVPKSNGSTTLDLIGGPVPKDDPSTLDPCNWQSEAQAAQLSTETGRSQIRFKSVKLGKPSCNASEEDPYNMLDKVDEPLAREVQHVPLSDDPSLKLVGYRQSTRTSLLQGIGKQLYASAPSLVEKQRI